MEKIWLQYNGTEIDIAQELLDRGVSKSDIVLGFQAAHRRRLTDYAVSRRKFGITDRLNVS